MQEIKFTSHKHIFFGRLFSVREKKTHANQSALQVFLLCQNRNDSQTFKSSSCKRFFASVFVIDANCFDQCFLFNFITRRHYFYQSLSLL